MKLDLLSIRRMPGLDPSDIELTKLGDGIHVLYGANGTGKTSVCKAIKTLLWRSSKNLEPISLTSAWTIENQRIEISLEGNHYKIYPPSYRDKIEKLLPPSRYASCYILTIEDLLSNSNEEFASEIARQLKGGYDFNSVRSHPCFTLNKFKGKAEKGKLNEATHALYKAKEKEKFLEKQEEALEKLSADLLKAQEAKELLPYLQDALKLIELEEQLAILLKESENFPPQMRYFQGNEAELYSQWTLQVKQIQEKIFCIEEKIRHYQEQLKVYALLPSLKAVKEAANLSEKLLQALVEEEVLNANLEKGRHILQKQLAFIHMHPEQLQEWSINAALKYRQIGIDYYNLKHKEEILQTRLKILSSEAPSYLHDQINLGILYLKSWKIHYPVSYKQIASSLSCFILAIGLYFYTPLEYVIAGFFIATCTSFFNLWNSSLKSIQAQYAQLPLPQPNKWTLDTVDAILVTLEKEWSKSIRYQEDTFLRQELSLFQNELNDEWDKILPLLADFHFQDNDPASSPLFFDQVHQILLTQAEINQWLSEKEQAAQEKNGLVKQISQLLNFDIEPLDVKKHIQSTQDQLNEALTIKNNLDNALAHLAEVTHEKQSIEGYLNALYEKCHCVGENREDQLNECLAHLNDYQNLRKNLLPKEFEIQILHHRMQKHPHLTQLSSIELSQLYEKCSTDVHNLNKWIEDKISIKYTLENAENAFNVEKALSHVLSAQQSFENAFEEHCMATMGQFWLEKIEEEYRRVSQPELFSKANEWFIRFTHSKYSLVDPIELANHKFEYAAYDNEARMIKRLSELSRGTQIQLTLAVRLAFIQMIEKGKTAIPLFLDEALSNCDPERFYEIVKALSEIASTGRQIFYFTCRESELESWRQISEKYVSPFHQISISRPPNLEAPVVQKAIREPLPEEALFTYANSMELEPYSPSKGIGHVPITCLVDSPKDLHALLSLHIRSYGQLKHSMQNFHIQKFLIEIPWQKVQCKCTLLEEFFELWHIGQGKHITQEILEKGGISDKYLPTLLDIAAEKEFNSSRLIDLLISKEEPRLKGFRQVSVDKLKETLLEEGFYDPRPCLSKEEIKHTVLQKAAPYIQDKILTFGETLEFVERLQSVPTVRLTI